MMFDGLSLAASGLKLTYDLTNSLAGNLGRTTCDGTVASYWPGEN